MPVLTDFLPKVYEITNRPDLVAETTSALTRALQRAHYQSEFAFDLQTQQYAYAGSQELIGALPARFRKYYNVTADKDIRIHEVTPAALFDDAVQMEKLNTFYIAGSNVVFTLTNSFQTINLMYLQVPTYADSYIATNYPEALTYLAAAQIFGGVMGNKEKANFWAGQVQDIDIELQRNHFAV